MARPRTFDPDTVLDEGIGQENGDVKKVHYEMARVKK
jgi:hypothetical protein